PYRSCCRPRASSPARATSCGRSRSLACCPPLSAGLQALHVVRTVTILDTVGVVPEAWETLVPRPECSQVAEIRTILRAGRFAGHEHGNARRVWHDTRGEHAVGEFLERHVLDLVAYQKLERSVRCHDGLGECRE